RASASASVGSYRYRGSDASIAGGSDNGSYFNLAAHYASTNGYRQSSWQQEKSVVGRFGLRGSMGQGFVDYSVYRSTNGLPGAISQAQFYADPTVAANPSDIQARDGYRIRPGIVAALGTNLTLEAELG